MSAYIITLIVIVIFSGIVIGMLYLMGGKKNLDKSIFSFKAYLYLFIAIFTGLSMIVWGEEVSLLSVAIIMVSIVECFSNFKEWRKH